MRLSKIFTALALFTAVAGCNLTKKSHEGVQRYSNEIAATGAAYLSDGTKARAAADESSPEVEAPPVGTPVEKVAEKDEFILVRWSDPAGAKQEGWVPKNKAEPAPDLAPHVERGADENPEKRVAGSRLQIKPVTEPAPPVDPPGWKPKEVAEEPPPENPGWKPKEVAEENPGWKPKEVAEENPGWKPKEEPPPVVAADPPGWRPTEPPVVAPDPPKEEDPKPGGWK